MGRYGLTQLHKDVINLPAYVGAELYLKKKLGWKYSADFLKHSLQNNPSNLVFDNNSKLAKKLKKNKQL